MAFCHGSQVDVDQPDIIFLLHYYDTPPLPQNSGTGPLSHLDSSFKTDTEQHNPIK